MGGNIGFNDKGVDNRYRSLYILLNELNRNTHLVEGLDVFAEWVTNSRGI